MKRIAILFLLAACSSHAIAPQTDIPPPLPVAPQQPDDVLACAHLAIIGCTSEAWPKHGTCVAAMNQLRTLAQQAPDAGIMDPLACIIAAPTPAAVRACGSHATLTIDCAVP